MRSLKALALLGALPLTACLSIYDVRQGKDNKVAGVPFYVRSAECRHKTVWLEPVYTLSLQVQQAQAAPGQPQPPLEEIATKSLGLKAFDAITARKPNQARSPLQDLVAKITAGHYTKVEDAQQDFNALISLATPPLQGNADDFTLASNFRVVETAVDYSKAYTYNVRRPWAGTASSTIKLNNDGTLGEATAEVEDKTFETIASLIPLKEFLTAEFIPTPPSDDTTGEAETADQPLRITLIVRTTVFRHTFSKADGAVAGPSCTAPTSNLGPKPTAGLDYLREEVKEPAAPKTDDKGKTIQLSGQIVLPEDKKPNP
jgi:hypothetical protein